MNVIATPLDTDMSHWGSGVRHYAVDDGTFVAVSVDSGVTDEVRPYVDEALSLLGVPTLASGVHAVVVEPTVIIACNADGVAESLDRLREYPPGTTHEQAIAQFQQERSEDD